MYTCMHTLSDNSCIFYSKICVYIYRPMVTIFLFKITLLLISNGVCKMKINENMASLLNGKYHLKGLVLGWAIQLVIPIKPLLKCLMFSYWSDLSPISLCNWTFSWALTASLNHWYQLGTTSRPVHVAHLGF